MTGSHAEPDKLAEVATLAAAIADRILDQHAAGTTIPPEQFTMLVRAARMLLDNDAPWPPSVERVLMEVAKRVARAEAPSETVKPLTRGDDVVEHLTHAFGALHPRDESAGPPTRSVAPPPLVGDPLDGRKL